MKYCVMTSTGFQMSGPGAATYNSAEEAAPHMGPGDQLVPIYETKVVKFPVSELERHGDR